MQTHCPNCDSPIDFDTADMGVMETISAVPCPNCGLVPFNVNASTVAASPGDELAEMVAHFRIKRLLGRGSFGSVWLAEDTQLGREIALKLAHKDRRETASLKHEAQSIAKLKHPNILSVYAVGDHDGQMYIASEFIDGLNLRDVLSTGRPSQDRAVGMALAIARALAHADEHGIVHRDVKPSNILIDSIGEPHVADFGLAKQIHSEVSISSEGQIVGTALYMSPEQASGRSNVDGRSDLYAVGVMLFEMLTGHLPFRGNVQAVLHQKVHEEPPSPGSLNQEIPRDLETICLKCIERDPERRYQSCAELADELERFSNGEPIKARPVSPIEKAWRWSLRHRLVAGLLLSLFASLTTGLLGVTFFGIRASDNAQLANERLYRSEMNLISQYLEKGDMDAVRNRLNRFVEDTPLSDLRDFEWYHFQSATAPFIRMSNQGDPVNDVAVFSDGRFYAASNDEKQLRIWDARSGELLRTIEVSGGEIRAIAASPAAAHVATASTDGFVRIWSPLQHDRPIQQFKHGPPVHFLAYSPNGKQILSAGVKGAVRIRDLASDEIIAQLPTGMRETKAVRFFPDGTAVAVANTDNMIRIWDVAEEANTVRISVDDVVESIAVSSDGKTIVAGSYTGQVHVYSLPDGELRYVEASNKGIIGDLEFLQRSPLLAIPSVTGELVIFDVDTREQVRHLQTHLLTAGLLAQSADGKTLAVGSGGGGVNLMEVGELIRRDVYWHDVHVRGAGFLPDSKHLITVDADGQSLSIALDSGEYTRLSASDGPRVVDLAVSPTKPRFAVAQSNSIVLVRDGQSHEVIEEIDAGPERVTALCYSPDGSKLVIGRETGRLTIHLTRSDQQSPVEWTPRKSAVNEIVFSNDGRETAIAFEDGSVQFFNGETGKERAPTIDVPAGALTLGYCVRAGKPLLVVGSGAGNLHFFDPSTGEQVQVVRAHGSRVNVIRTFPGSNRLISGGRDKELKIWDIKSGELVTTLYGHSRQIFCIAVSPDGRTVASGGLDGDVRIWPTVE